MLRITVLAMVLAVLPAKAPAFEAPFVEIPVLVVAAKQSPLADEQPALPRRVSLSAFEPRDMSDAAPLRSIEEQRFVRVFRRFVVECSWLC